MHNRVRAISANSGQLVQTEKRKKGRLVHKRVRAISANFVFSVVAVMVWVWVCGSGVDV